MLLAGRMAVTFSRLPSCVLPPFSLLSGTLACYISMQGLLGIFPQKLRAICHSSPGLQPSVIFWRTGYGCHPQIWGRSVSVGLSSEDCWILLLSLSKTMAQMMWHPMLEPLHPRFFCSCLTSENMIYYVSPALLVVAYPERDRVRWSRFIELRNIYSALLWEKIHLYSQKETQEQIAESKSKHCEMQ